MSTELALKPPAATAADAGARVVLPVHGMTCASCVAHVEKALAKVPGVEKVAVNLATESAAVEGAALDIGALRAAIVVTAPTGGTRTASWREDPGCKHPKPLYREDGTSVTHPDCLVISAVAAVPATNAAAEVYGLRKIVTDIEDRPDNTTRFLIIGREVLPASGQDKTSILLTTPDSDDAGALHKLLAPLASEVMDALKRVENGEGRRGWRCWGVGVLCTQCAAA